MSLFPSVRKSTQEVSRKLGELVAENEVLKSIIVRSESQVAVLSDEVSCLRTDVNSLATSLRAMFDGSSSFRFPAGPGSAVQGYQVYPDYGTPVDIDKLSPEDQVRERKRKKIADKVFEYAAMRGLSTKSDSIGAYYTNFYDRLEEATGYRPKKATSFKYLGPRGRKVCTLIEEGYADIFVALIQQEIDAIGLSGEDKASTTKKRRGRPKKNAA